MQEVNEQEMVPLIGGAACGLEVYLTPAILQLGELRVRLRPEVGPVGNELDDYWEPPRVIHAVNGKPMPPSKGEVLATYRVQVRKQGDGVEAVPVEWPK